MTLFLAAAREGADAVRQNWRAFLVIVAAAWALAALFYLVPGLQAGAEALARHKTQGGIVFAAISTAVACISIPEIGKRIMRQPPTPLADYPFLFLFWAGIGIMVDVFYAYLGRTIGVGTSPGVVVQKVLCDQFLFSPFITMPYGVILFGFKEAGYRFSKLPLILGGGVGWRRWLATTVTCWGFWIPTVTAVYALPGDVKFLMFLAMEGTWGVLLVHILSRAEEISGHN